jgi:hypothetical protein
MEEQLGQSDPVLAKSKIWREASAEHARWAREQARLETELVRRIGFPGIDVDVPGKPAPVFVQDADTLRLLLGDGPATKQLERKLRDVLHAWQGEAERVGFLEAKRHERETGEHADELARAVLSARSSTLEGAIEKLTVLVEALAPGPDAREDPWPALRLLASDLKRLARNA